MIFIDITPSLHILKSLTINFLFFSLHCVILVLESIMFGIFVIAILIYQFQAIFDDETAIERLQGSHSNRRNTKTFALLSQVCGKSHPIFWLLPCHNPPRYSYRRDFLIDHEV